MNVQGIDTLPIAVVIGLFAVITLLIYEAGSGSGGGGRSGCPASRKARPACSSARCSG